ncbi:MAG: alpha/beta fold hydrolase [Saprospiraceae bacterium]
MMKPSTSYTKSGRINIAYQVFGSGKTDLVYIPGWVSNIDLMWNCPELVSFLEALGKVTRVILFDKRGTGLSDRIVEISTLEERMDDIRAVMDAVNSEKAILFGHSEGGSASALFAATYPSRTIALITFGVFAKRRYSPDYPWAPTDEERQKVYDMIEESWGGGNMNLSELAPTKANDKVFMDWLANYFRSGASPSAALVLTRMNTQVDIIGILPSINVPTLLMQRVDDIDVKIEEGRFIAERIKDAKLVEFDGEDHLFWTGNTEEILREMITFIKELEPIDVKPINDRERQLLVIMVAEISPALVQPTDQSLPPVNVEQVNMQLMKKYRGKLHHMDGKSCIATFEGSGKALNYCLDFQKMMSAIKLNFKAGIHVGECLIVGDKIVETNALDKTKHIQRIATANQILVSQTVKYLISEAGLKFSKIDTSQNTNMLPPLFEVEDQYSELITGPLNNKAIQKNGFLLENVLQCIDENLSDEFFSVETLSQDIGLSERQLQRKLKAITNKSPNQLIRSVRLHRAKELLLKRNENIAEVAFQTGFSNPSYFSKCFKSEFGVSPSEFLL